MPQFARSTREKQTEHRILNRWLADSNSQAKEQTGRNKHKTQLPTNNLKHSTTATENLLKITDEEGTDIFCIQEPYSIGNKIVGLPRSYAVFVSGEGRKRAAIVINNKQTQYY